MLMEKRNASTSRKRFVCVNCQAITNDSTASALMHNRRTCRFQGHYFSLTDLHGEVIIGTAGFYRFWKFCHASISRTETGVPQSLHLNRGPALSSGTEYSFPQFGQETSMDMKDSFSRGGQKMTRHTFAKFRSGDSCPCCRTSSRLPAARAN